MIILAVRVIVPARQTAPLAPAVSAGLL